MKPINSNKKNSDFFTTGQVADFCGVNFRTVIRWIQKGYLEAQRLPGRGDHRIAKDQLIKFFNQNNLPIPLEFSNETVSAPVEQRRVLIVDDDETTAQIIKAVLSANNYDTKVAASGFEAGRLVETFNPDVITLDLIMKEMDGLAVLKSLKNSRKIPKIKVIIISGDSDTKIAEALRLGAVDSLKKPIQSKELLELVLKHSTI